MKLLGKLPPYLLTLVVGLAICWLALAPHPLPEGRLPLFPHADKIAHALMFGGFCAALYIDMWRSGNKANRICGFVAFVTSCAAGGAVEIVQYEMGLGRSADVMDFIADVIGAGIALVVCYLIFRNKTCVLPWGLRKKDRLDEVKKIYTEAFPPEERRPWHEVLTLLDKMGGPFAINLISLDGRVVGFISSWNLDDFVYIEHFAMKPSLRNRGLGARVLRHFCSGMKKPVVLEAEPAANGETAQRRISFYERNGFSAFKNFQYVQPPYAPGLPEVPLTLMSTSKEIDLKHVESQLHKDRKSVV